MVSLETPVCEFDADIVDFSLPGVDGNTWSVESCRGENGLLVMFICNHCPYVRSVIDAIVADARALAAEGIGAIAIMANDTERYPADSFDNMKRFAAEHDFPFPYVIDESQDIARAYDAVCTPDFFGFNADLELQYRGRLDESKTERVPDAKRELLEAMRQVVATGRGPEEQIPSMGCSIKWREAS